MDVKYRPVVFSNGGGASAAKKMRPAAAAAAAAVVGDDSGLSYRECLKNHAASLGGHAVDGCGEFMPSPAADPSNPGSLKCAACGCHRNFHRRLLEAPPPSPPPLLALPPVAPAPHYPQYPQRGEETPERRMPVAAAGDDDYSDDSEERSDYSEEDDDRPASPPLPAPGVAMPPAAPAGYLSATHMLLSLSTSGAPSAPAAMASRPPGPTVPAGLHPQPGPGGSSSSSARKRFRTKFSPEQKQQMQALSERLGWRLQKSDEAVVHERCREIGVGKGVFKVWMHNNKHNFVGGHSARRSASLSTAGAPQHYPSASPTPAPPPPSAPPVHADFNINGSAPAAAAAGDHHSAGFQRPATATASGGSGSPQSA